MLLLEADWIEASRQACAGFCAEARETEMFEQTFVDGTQKTKKPYTILLSLSLQIRHHRHRDFDSADLHTNTAERAVEEHVGGAAAAAASTAATAAAAPKVVRRSR